MSVDIGLSGISDLVEKAQALGRKGSSAQNAALKAAVQPIADNMKKLVRVSNINENHIRDDIQISNVKTQNGIKYIRTGPSKKTNWRAKFLEFGTSKMPAYPFMSPSYENNKEISKQIMKAKLKESLGL